MLQVRKVVLPVVYLAATVASVYFPPSVFAQTVPVIPGVQAAQEGAANNPPTWQAMCGYKWRQYRQATGASGRDAYVAFQRTPSKDGGCGADETTATRKPTAKPNDDRIKAYIDQLGTKVPGVPEPQASPDVHGELPQTWQDARRGGGRHG
jgi:hypothetical protein